MNGYLNIKEWLSKYKKETRTGHEKVTNRFLQEIGDELSRDTFIAFRDKYQFEPYGYNLFKVLKTFFRWFKDKTGDRTFQEYAEMLKWRGIKKKQEEEMIVSKEQAINLEKMRKAIDIVLNYKFKKQEFNNNFAKLRAITTITFGCSTGLRPYELGRTDEEEIEHAFKHNYFILSSKKSKTAFNRVIPINKETRWLLSEFMKIWNNPKVKKRLQLKGTPFARSTMVKLIKKPIEGIELDNLRDFCTQHSLRVLKIPEFFEAMVLGHDTDKFKVRIENYLQGKVSNEEIAKDWLEYWDEVTILTEKQRKEVERLIEKITTT